MSDALLENAEELIDAAWDALDVEDHERAAISAEEALSFTSSAIDGYVILARISRTPAIRIALLREGLRRGQQLFAPALKEPKTTDFWLELRTRPYMRCASALAIALWQRNETGERDEALGLLRHLLKINPADHQGIRFLAWNWFAEHGAWDELTRTLRRYRSEERTETSYTWALDAWRRRDPAADDALAKAFALNPHVPALLLQMHAPFGPAGEAAPYRSRSEAVAYAMHAHGAWRAVPDAVEWLARRARDVTPA